ncbi:DUF1569 domain-containing protein [Saccharibacillus sacchari]|uniref:DUF1569 domain-containing protein n=1 Tax=Saccharibacillus sacchari TaxID=456493 RepID=A0ACC6P751_9BACL
MKNIFDLPSTEEILTRIDQLQPNVEPSWGKMNVAQMLAHCSAFQDIATGDKRSSRSWLGIVVGRLAKPVFYNDKPLPRDMSTIPILIIPDPQAFDAEKEILKQKLQTLQHVGPDQQRLYPHPFFGKLSAEEWGKGIYKHLDHHLRQFNV